MPNPIAKSRFKEGVIEKRLRVNQQIRVPQVRLIDTDGTQLGVKPIQEAILLAKEKEKDLVEIAPNSDPPVCKIIEFSKFKYDQSKKERENKMKQKVARLKEIRLTPRIGVHDLQFKINHAKEFFQNGDKVQFTIVFKGRENTHKDLGYALAQKIIAELSVVSEIEKNASTLGNKIIFILALKKTQ